MAFIRPKTEERTGFQISAPLFDKVDCQSDFVMVYGMNESTVERIRAYREKGYVIHLMTGIAWGHYVDYLDGEWDGQKHWDESQTDRFGNAILHSQYAPYMVPTVSFADYMSEKLRAAVDAGVEAIHVEEPEFWDRAGYSPAFRREYELYYHEPWTPPHESCDGLYKAAKLKAYLYTRTIDRVSASLKAYAKTKWNRDLRFYVPTHSLLNYTQWKIVSPEGKLADLPYVDGCIAQVWTGTSREKNWFNGEFRERTFETAFLEYGVMQELVKGTGRKMWFLHDPIEDNPIFDWNDYRKNYLCTVAASLMHPKVNTYEICPWPNRVFEGTYPKNAPDAEPISADYATLLNNMFQTLGTMECEADTELRIGILMGDCQFYQRAYPDCLFSEKAKEQVGTVLHEDDDFLEKLKAELFTMEKPQGELLYKYMSSNAFPAFYALALPLLKYGVPVRPVLLDNARRYPGYLEDYDVLLLSYEYMKPDYPDMNASIAQWVRQGGTLIYIGDGSDPYNAMQSWWTGKHPNPAAHLFESLEIEPTAEREYFDCGKGHAAVWNIHPCVFSFSKERADTLRDFFTETLTKAGKTTQWKNHLLVHRGPYVIASVMEESVSEEPLVLRGNYCDMFTSAFELCREKTVPIGGNALLLDLDAFAEENLCVLGTSVRIRSLTQSGNTVTVDAYGAGALNAALRIRVPFAVDSAFADGEPCSFTYDAPSRTVLVRYMSAAKPVTLTLCGKDKA